MTEIVAYGTAATFAAKQ